jgi:hypothetical protein
LVTVVLVSSLLEQKITVIQRPAAATPTALAEGMTPPAPMQAILEPQPAPPTPANVDLTTVFPPSQLPDVATVQGASISLACLARNGANLSKPMPSKHSVFAANQQTAAQLRVWAQENGFDVRDQQMFHSHTGTPEYQFNLVRVEVPAPEKIELEGRMILSAVQQIPGTYYQSWCGEIVR